MQLISWFRYGLIAFITIVIACSLQASGIQDERHQKKLEEYTGALKRYFPNKEQTPIEGVISRITDTETVWVKIENRKAFRKWNFKLAPDYQNPKTQEIQIQLQYVSPKKSINFGKKYNDWLKKTIVYEASKNFRGRRVSIYYDYLGRARKLVGVVQVGDSSINLWMVKSGWSFYLINEGTAPNNQEYLNAERYAAKHTLGIWKAIEK